MALIMLALLGTSDHAVATWLILCDEAGNAAQQSYLMPDGRGQVLQVADAENENCISKRIATASTVIGWRSLVSEEVANSSKAGIGLLGEQAEHHYNVSEVIPINVTGSSQRSPIPTTGIGVDLLPILSTNAFGIENRMAISIDAGGLTVACRPGTQPAGALMLTRDFRLPAQAQIEMGIRYRSTAPFSVGFSGPDELRRESPNLIGHLPARTTADAIRLSLPPVTDSRTHAFSVVCPNVEARLEMEDLVLHPIASDHLTERATWIWRHQRWSADPDLLIEQLTAHRMTTVFISIPLTNEPLQVTNPGALARFLELAASTGIDVWAVEGDPAAVTSSGRRYIVERERALIRFNAEQVSNARLAGIQYDIEPYLLPGFDLARDEWLMAYVDTLRELKSGSEMPIEVAVPFWWSGLKIGDAPILDVMADQVDGITVMNYRTDPEQLWANGVPYLEWGQRANRYVRMALEAGPLPDQILRNYRPNVTGRLWQVPIGDRTALLLLDKPAENPDGLTFARSHDVPVPAKNTTFHSQRERLDKLVPQLSLRWSIWPVFAGIALHEYVSDSSEAGRITVPTAD